MKLTASVAYGKAIKERTFEVTVVKKNEPVKGLQKLGYDEIVDMGGTVGTRYKDAVQAYAMDYLYGQRMDGYLKEYENHSHSGWSWLEGEQPGKWLESMANANGWTMTALLKRQLQMWLTVWQRHRQRRIEARSV